MFLQHNNPVDVSFIELFVQAFNDPTYSFLSFVSSGMFFESNVAGKPGFVLIGSGFSVDPQGDPTGTINTIQFNSTTPLFPRRAARSAA